jgi:hypothetical protein
MRKQGGELKGSLLAPIEDAVVRPEPAAEFELSDEACAEIDRILDACEALEAAGHERPCLPESALNVGGDFALVQARRKAGQLETPPLREGLGKFFVN